MTLLSQQISKTIHSNRIDDTSCTSLLPCLVVLYKFCQVNPTFLQATTEAVFPSETEIHFRRLIAEREQHQEQQEHHHHQQPPSPTGQGKSTTNNKTTTTTNWSPLDAPHGTLRHDLIKLLTWPHSSTKRFAGELLWILCKQNPQEFVYRVGMGNALPLLSQKGLASLPANAYS